MSTLNSLQIRISKKLQEEIEISQKIKAHLKLLGTSCQTLAKELTNQLFESLKAQELYRRQLILNNKSDLTDKLMIPASTSQELLNEQIVKCTNIAKRLRKSLELNLPPTERLECLQKRRRIKQFCMLLKEILNENRKYIDNISVPKCLVNNFANNVSIRIIGCDQLNREFSFDFIIAGFPGILKNSLSDDLFLNSPHNSNALVKCDLIINNHVLFSTEARRPSHHCWNQTFEFTHDYGNLIEINITFISPYRSLDALIKKTASHYRELDFMLSGFAYLTLDEEKDKGFINRVIELYPGGRVFVETTIKTEIKRKVNGKVSTPKSSAISIVTPSLRKVPKSTKISIQSDFKLLALLGTGKFGKIILCQNQATKKFYALKAQKKAQIIEKNDYATILEEKEILKIITKCNHPFLVHLFACLQDKKYVMFLLEFVEAGDLATLIYKLKFFHEKLTRFYAAIVVLCIEFLHDNDIMYRDLKMENLLIDKQGYLKLVDFGLSKTNMNKHSVTTTFCGTIDYIAPELLVDNGYSRMVDWWALGILVYFMTTGKVPFAADTEQDSFNAIITRPISLPHKTDPSLLSLILSLLDRNPFSRLGSKNGAKDIKAHPYFKSINFSRLYSKEIISPFIPNLQHELDLSYFDEQFIGKKPTLDSADSITAKTCDEKSFFDNFCL